VGLGDHRKPPHQDRAKAATVDVIGHLDGNFGEVAVEASIDRVADYLSVGAAGHEAAVTGTSRGAQMGLRSDVGGTGKEAKAPRVQTQGPKESGQRGLVGLGHPPDDHV
jgi:hypothetical protein